MAKLYICDRCEKPLKEDSDFGGKAMVYKGRTWRGRSCKYTHYHYCKKCFKELFE